LKGMSIEAVDQQRPMNVDRFFWVRKRRPPSGKVSFKSKLTPLPAQDEIRHEVVLASDPRFVEDRGRSYAQRFAKARGLKFHSGSLRELSARTAGTRRMPRAGFSTPPTDHPGVCCRSNARCDDSLRRRFVGWVLAEYVQGSSGLSFLCRDTQVSGHSYRCKPEMGQRLIGHYPRQCQPFHRDRLAGFNFPTVRA